MTSKQKIYLTTLTGILFTLAYCVVTASSSVLVNHAEKNYDELLLMFSSFLLTTIFFNITNFKQTGHLYRSAYENFALVLKLNMTSAILWLSTFYGLKYLSPALFVAIYMGSRPITTYLLTRHESSDSQKKRNFRFASLIAFCFLALIFEDLANVEKWIQEGLLMLLALLAGTAASLNNLYAYQLNLNKFNATQVIAIRFIVIILILLALLLHQPIRFTGLNHDMLTIAVITAVFTLALPIYLLQKGLERIGPLKVAFLAPFIPVMTFLIELIIDKDFDSIQFIIICTLSFIILLSQRQPTMIIKPGKPIEMIGLPSEAYPPRVCGSPPFFQNLTNHLSKIHVKLKLNFSFT